MNNPQKLWENHLYMIYDVISVHMIYNIPSAYMIYNVLSVYVHNYIYIYICVLCIMYMYTHVLIGCQAAEQDDPEAVAKDAEKAGVSGVRTN